MRAEIDLSPYAGAFENYNKLPNFRPRAYGVAMHVR